MAVRVVLLHTGHKALSVHNRLYIIRDRLFNSECHVIHHLFEVTRSMAPSTVSLRKKSIIYEKVQRFLFMKGLMMGILTSVGSLARALGPIFVSLQYSVYGPRVSVLFLLSFIVLAFVIIAISYKRLKPYQIPDAV
jgi:hypothetical protein